MSNFLERLKMNRKNISCKKVIKLISKHFDRQINYEAEQILLEHINICPSCKKEFYVFEKICANIYKQNNINLNPFFNEKLKSFIIHKQKNLTTIFKPVTIFFTITIFLFILTFPFLKNISSSNSTQKSFYTKDTFDYGEIVFGLIEFLQESNFENYNILEG